jgi:hypothetical protein
MSDSWMFLGVRVDIFTAPGAPVVAEATLPAGASPPLHVHADLDDSFYVLEGRLSGPGRVRLDPGARGRRLRARCGPS